MRVVKIAIGSVTQKYVIKRSDDIFLRLNKSEIRKNAAIIPPTIQSAYAYILNPKIVIPGLSINNADNILKNFLLGKSIPCAPYTVLPYPRRASGDLCAFAPIIAQPKKIVK